MTPKQPETIPYGVLSQRNPEYDPDLLKRIEDLYVGGWRIQRKSREYLPKLAFEHDKPYDARCATTSYQPYFAQIVDQLTSDLFNQPLSIAPAGDAEDPDTPGDYPDEEYYTSFAEDVDRKGTGLVDLMRCTTRTALKHKCAYVAVDAPRSGSTEEPETLADEENQGLRRLYAYEIAPEQIIDWELDDLGEYEWLILYRRDQKRGGPTGNREMVTESFTVWQRAEKATWARYEITFKLTEPPTSETLVKRADDGVSSFPAIPILRLELPDGLWVGNKIGPQALEHWRRRSALVGAEARSCVAIPCAFLGPELPPQGEMTSEVQQDPDRGAEPMDAFARYGYIRLGEKDRFEFAEPEGHAYEVIEKQIDGVKDEMFRVNHLMAASVKNTASSMGRSGLSKQKDGEATAKVLGVLGQIVREFTLKMYKVIAAARDEDVVWSAHGLDSYEVNDRQEILEEAQATQLIQIPSPTWKKEHAFRLSQKLVPGLSPDTVAVIRKEIVDGIDQQQELDDLTHDAKKDLIQNPPGPNDPVPPIGAVQ